jgi:hypothetical protein
MTLRTVASTERVVLHTRADVRREHLAAFDRWQRTKHMPEALRAPTCRRAAHYHTVRDGLPAVWHGSGNVAANYYADDLDGIFAFLTSPELAEAVSDGVLWFDRFNELDGADYTGNIYHVAAGAGASEAPADAPFLAERFEVEPDDLDAFDAWLAEHAAAVAGADAVTRVSVLHAIREGSPLPYYYSQGNRALFVELTEARGVLGAGLKQAVAESQAWDLRLPYVRRDVYECAFVVEA